MFEDDFDDEQRDINELLNTFEKVKNGVQNETLSEEEFEDLIDYFESIGDRSNIRAACELGISHHPYSVSLKMAKVEWLLSQKKFGQALILIEEVHRIAPGDLDALILHADILVESKKVSEAANMLENKLNQFGDEDKVFILWELSDIYDELAEYSMIVRSLRRLLKINPHYEDALLKYCFWCEVTQSEEEGIALLNEILDETPFYASAWYGLGMVHQSIKGYEKAIDAYEYCLAVDDKYEYAYRNLGECYIQTKEFDKAIETLELHLKITKPDDDILETLGYCWERKKDFAKARHYYRKASHLNPSDDEIFYKIGETYAKEHKWEKAIRSYSAALHMNKDNVTYCLALGNCLMEIESSEDALVCYLNAVKLRPDIKSTWQALIKALYKAEYYDEAKNQLMIAREHCGEKAEFMYYEAAILMSLGRTKEAVIVLENAVESYPKKYKSLQQIDKEMIHHPIVAEVLSRYRKK